MNAATDKTAEKPEEKPTTDKPTEKPTDKQNQPDEIRHPKPAEHNDDARSRMPERGDKSREQSPADRPGKEPGEGEPPVG